MTSDNPKKGDLMEFAGEDKLVFADELDGAQKASEQGQNAPWRVLIIDDEQTVHEATQYSMRGCQIMGRSIEFLHAHSSSEAVKILKVEDDIAVILLDVVMETSNAGLDLVPRIRNELNITASRIILRTGEPNQAPEMEIIKRYDINDYKLKSELNKDKLYVTLTTAIRSYQQIRTIENSKKGLDLILRSSSELITQEGLNKFAQGVITHIAALVNVPPEGLICVRRKDFSVQSQSVIIAAAGDYRSLINQSLAQMPPSIGHDLLQQSLDNRCNVFHKQGIALYLGSHSRGDMSCFISNGDRLSQVDHGLLEMFCHNISLCADNISFMDRLKNFAFTDTLVGIPNRNALEEIIDSHIGKHSSVPFALALIDIDNFAEINAVLGQEYGDQLLKAAADRLAARFYSPNTVARVGGDTFAVFGPMSHIDSKSLVQPFVSPFKIGAELQLLSVTAGIVPLSEIQGGGAAAIKDAAIVLKQAKNFSRGEVVMFERKMVAEARNRLEMLRNLRSAFELNQLFLVFQPKLRLSDLSVTGFEALIRWRDSGGRFISPVDFIPLAEQSGLIVRMGEWILRSAIAELAILRQKGYRDAHMAVNLSVAQLEHQDILEMLRRVMGESDIDPSFIELEITESIAMGDTETNLKRLQEIRNMGFKLSMDDFGTGFSSLTYLQRMPINCLKIDRSFINTSATNGGRGIVEMIIQLGKTLGLNVIAEGVEDEIQGLLLKEMGCHEVQGFFYARPMPRDELHKWLAQRKKGLQG